MFSQIEMSLSVPKQTNKAATVTRATPIRMKHVFNRSAEVCHYFANQRDQGDGSADYGRNGSDNCSFHGDTLKSYRTIIAKRFNEHGILLVTTINYSRTTNGQIDDCLSAFRGHTIQLIRVPTANPVYQSQHLQNFNHLWGVANRALMECTQSHTKWNSAELIKAYRALFLYASKFGMRRLLSAVDRKIETIINTAAKPAKSKTKQTKASLPHENDILQRITGDADFFAATLILGLMGIRDNFGDAAKPIEQHLAEQFQSAIQVHYSTQQCLDEYRESENNLQISFNRRSSDENYKRFSSMTPTQQLQAWKTHEPGIVGFVTQWPNLGMRVSEVFPNAKQNFGDYRVPPKTPDDYRWANNYSVIRCVRLSADKQTVETSGDIQLPVKEFLFFWRTLGTRIHVARHNPGQLLTVMQSVIEISRQRSINRAFTIEAIDRETGNLKIGCHILVWDDLNSLAVELGEPSMRWKTLCLPSPSAD
jgi:hypothetical protein